MSISYREAGVNITAGEQAVDQIKTLVRETYTPAVLTDLGLFGGCYQIPVQEYREPVLVASTDGVGTKLMIANLLQRHDTVGQCLVNHCVNDILTVGARPLFFLDYIGTGQVEPETIKTLVSGMATACRENGCALIGGEMAEMPGIYRPRDYDLVGTIVGIVEKSAMLVGRVRVGDVLIGLRSTGLHTNGYSLARKVLLEKYQVSDYIEELGQTLGDALLSVHRSYLDCLKPLFGQPGLHGLSHITGGGIVGNTSRLLPSGLKLAINWQAWNRPPIFNVIQQTGDIEEAEMRRVFNLGIGMIVIADNAYSDTIYRSLKEEGERATMIGEVIAGD